MPHEGSATKATIPRRALLVAGLALLGGALPMVRETLGQDSGPRSRTVKGLYLSYHGVGDRTVARVADEYPPHEQGALCRRLQAP